MSSWRHATPAVFAAVLLACGSGGTDDSPASWTAPGLLIVDHRAGLFRHGAAEGEPRQVASEADGLVGPLRALRLDDGRIAILASGDAEGEGRGLYLYDEGEETVTKWIDLAGPWIPTDVAQIRPSTLLLCTRKIEAGDPAVKTSALHEIDLVDGSVRLLLEPPELVAALSLHVEDGGRSVLVLDGDANPTGQTKFEGVLYRYVLETGALETVRVFENTVSPLQLLPLEGTNLADEAEYLLVDVNALPPPENPWVGTLFLMNAEQGEVRPFLIDAVNLVDPVRGFIHEGRLILTEMSTNPGGHDTVKSEISYAGFRGRGAIYTVDLATRHVEPLVHSPLFVDPVDVLPLR